MKAVANLGIGTSGTLIAWLESGHAAACAGYATAAWMVWQLGCSVYDRLKKKGK